MLRNGHDPGPGHALHECGGMRSGHGRGVAVLFRSSTPIGWFWAAVAAGTTSVTGAKLQVDPGRLELARPGECLAAQGGGRAAALERARSGSWKSRFRSGPGPGRLPRFAPMKKPIPAVPGPAADLARGPARHRRSPGSRPPPGSTSPVNQPSRSGRSRSRPVRRARAGRWPGRAGTAGRARWPSFRPLTVRPAQPRARLALGLGVRLAPGWLGPALAVGEPRAADPLGLEPGAFESTGPGLADGEPAGVGEAGPAQAATTRSRPTSRLSRREPDVFIPSGRLDRGDCRGGHARRSGRTNYRRPLRRAVQSPGTGTSPRRRSRR